MMWTKAMVLGVAAVGAMAATSSCGSTEEELRMEDGTGAVERAAGQLCGGIAGIPCPKGTRCVDDPSDSCDPEHGGADCGGVCVAEEQAVTGAAERAAGQLCGGIAGIPCPEGTRCVDDPSDSCDPEHGGADCGGVCVAEKQAVKCGMDPRKRYILRDPAQCAAVRFVCEQGSQPFFNACGCGCQAGEICGSAVCGAGQFCCNASCSICAPKGGYCTQQQCVAGAD